MHLITLSDTHALGRTALDERSTGRRDLYLTTHNNRKRQTSLPPAVFEPAIPAREWPQTRLRPRCHRDRPVHRHLYKTIAKVSRVQRQVVELESGYRTRSMNRGLEYSNGSVAIRTFQSLLHICGERMESEWAQDIFVWPTQGG